MHNDLDNLIPLMKSKGVTLSKEAFHQAVNTTFHDVESQYYDALHKDMDTSLQQQYDLLANDVLTAGIRNNLTLLDIGCGTGMSTEKLLKSPLGKSISKIYLLDTSKGMLAQCRQKADKWNVPYEQIHGDLYTASNIKADIILTSSVLHHIPNLPDFLEKVQSLQNSRGYFIHLQDPNGDHIFSDLLAKRYAEFRSYKRMEKLKKNPVGTLLNKIVSKLNKGEPEGEEAYIAEVNKRLLISGVVKSPMSDAEIWSVTDIHVDGLPNSHGKGISIAFLKKQLRDYDFVQMRSYAFFGELKMHLPEPFKILEEQWINENKADGRNLAAVWQLKQ